METEIVETIERARWKHIYQFINGVEAIQEIPKLEIQRKLLVYRS